MLNSLVYFFAKNTGGIVTKFIFVMFGVKRPTHYLDGVIIISQGETTDQIQNDIMEMYILWI